MQLEIIHFREIGSTSDYALTAIETGIIKANTAILADSQTNGRGRLNGRIWQSPIGNFYCSYIVDLTELHIKQNETNILTSYVMHILCSHLKSITNSTEIYIKQPNDILVKNKKLAAILTEISYPYAVIGIGINLLTSPIDCSTNIFDEFNILVKPVKLVETFYGVLMHEVRQCYKS